MKFLRNCCSRIMVSFYRAARYVLQTFFWHLFQRYRRMGKKIHRVSQEIMEYTSASYQPFGLRFITLLSEPQFPHLPNGVLTSPPTWGPLMSCVIRSLPCDHGGVLLKGQHIGKRSFIYEIVRLLGKFFWTLTELFHIRTSDSQLSQPPKFPTYIRFLCYCNKLLQT